MKGYQVIAGPVMHLTQVTRYDLTHAVNKIVRVVLKPLKTHIGVTELLLPYRLGSTNFNIT